MARASSRPSGRCRPRISAGYATKRDEQLAKTLNGEQEPRYFKERDAEERW
jgi:hypothetical protein